jgi:pimeloyl-ACP methyl ester carboxylesterase
MGSPAGAGEGGVDGGAGLALAVACDDTIGSIYDDPGALPPDNGAILRCARDVDISRTDLEARARANASGDSAPAQNGAYDGKPFTSGARVYRVLFRTERGDGTRSPGYSSAKVFLPDTPRAASLPVVVGARGSRGQAPACTASKEDPAADAVNPDYRALAYPLVGLGFPVIIPDLAGYAGFGAAGNPVSAYGLVTDVGKGTLDGARAMRKLVRAGLDDQTVLVGHSQGGDSALASLAIAASYAPDVHIAAVALYAPLWFSQRSWAALFQAASQLPIHGAAGANAVSVWYHYTHGELLDGPGHGGDVFAADKRDAIKDFVDNDCWGSSYPRLEALGTTSLDLFDPTFIGSVKAAAALGQPCKDGDALCAKWIARYLADRPHLTAAAATTPLLITYGTSDQTIPPQAMACVFDRLTEDQARLKVCLTPGFGHGGNVRRSSGYVVDWIAARTLATPEPDGCAVDQSGLVEDGGAPVACGTFPPND